MTDGDHIFHGHALPNGKRSWALGFSTLILDDGWFDYDESLAACGPVPNSYFQ
jgi:hypothetical protein